MNARDIPLEYLDAYREGYSRIMDRRRREVGILAFRHVVSEGPPIGGSPLEWAYHTEGMSDALDILAALRVYKDPTYTNVPVNLRSGRHGPVNKPEGLLCKLKSTLQRLFKGITRNTRD